MRAHPLYVITAMFGLGLLVWAGYLLLGTAAPSNDVVADTDRNFPQIRASDYATGEVSIVLLDRVPVIVWRRNQEDIEAAKEQDGLDQWPTPYSIVSGHSQPQFAHDANLTVNHEWLFVSAINSGGFGCVVLSRAGDYGGFFDPCRGDHFDLAGRFRKGASGENLRVIGAELGSDGQLITLNLTGVPRAK